MRINDLVLGLVMALLGAITVLASRDFYTLPRQDFGAGTFPTLIGSLLIVLGLLLALRGWLRRGPLFVWQGTVAPSRTLICLGAVVAAVSGYVWLTPLLGFPVLAMAMLTVLIGWLSRGRWGLAVAVAAVVTLLIWLGFAMLLHVPLDLGFLEGVIY
ncbi:Tripartite tricarboxylate transporter TctB family protein [Halomonas sp. THAF12]|uniref:tripartite tricarboxylate transporter TctB family protein n=1 Tax=Halomonas sp. THAF12 TaxID=2587849 RepID=UPI00126895DB|nr:tripartite tricarboxylate transporter TctB family protein [Halomonas sp. THAF12]QFT83667.1 Tripartite tricarboxylate transporter TctB family protein [Halomonas sp. THAF12]